MERTFNLERLEDREAFHAEAKRLEREKSIDYRRASEILASRVTHQNEDVRRDVDTSNPAVRAALATEAKRRIELSRVESIRRHGDARDQGEFSRVLDDVVNDLRVGVKVLGFEREE